MGTSEPDLWADDHMTDVDGTVTTLVEHARAGVDPQVGQLLMVGDGEQALRPARVIERTRDGFVVVRFEDRPSSALPA
ncbi:MAG: hypothetical protein ACRD0L_03425 [Acidimicrobiales bacterium]